MKRKIWWVLMVAGLFMATSLFPQTQALSVGNQTKIINSFTYENKNLTSNCLAIRMESNHTIHIGEIFLKAVMKNERTTKWIFADRLFLINIENKIFWSPPIVTILKQGRITDIYFQIGVGKDFFYSHLSERTPADITSMYNAYNISLPEGRWYLIYMASPVAESQIRVYINDTDAFIINVSEYSSSSISENEDFHANLNLKTFPLSIIFQGEMRIQVNNTFIGFFYAPTGSISVASMRYIAPDGTTGKAVAWESKRGFFVTNESDFTPVFEPIVGGEGEWIFNVNMIGVGMATAGIFWADIKLP
ncbi:MAG: hypothetical protein J7L31_04775 [Thermoplasmata archaeon]|nr:hypothetical protein [Thermoplasmata archaeon]